LLTHKRELQLDHLSAPVTSHIFLFTNAELYLVTGSPKSDNSNSANIIPITNIHAHCTIDQINNQMQLKKYDFFGRQIFVYDAASKFESVYANITDCSLLKDNWSKYSSFCSLKIMSELLNFTYPRTSQ